MDPVNKHLMEERRPEARYANYFAVGSNAFEFLVDFGQFFQDSDNEIIHTCIITNPGYARALLDTLQNAISQHENLYGQIEQQNQDYYS